MPCLAIRVWEDNGEEDLLLEFVLEEMQNALSRKPLPVYAEYDECFKKIEPFRMAVENARTDRILMGWRDRKREEREGDEVGNSRLSMNAESSVQSMDVDEA